jgi:hypothetical protein
MNRLDVCGLPARCACEHTHGAQKYQAETMHGLGPTFFKGSLTTKISLDLRARTVNAKSEP